MTVAERLAELGIALPPPAAPAGLYRPAVVSGPLCFVSGQVNVQAGELTARGHLGAQLTPEEGAAAARVAAINCLAAAAGLLGSLDRVLRVVQLTGYVAGDSGFTQQPQVINGASTLLRDVFGEAGVGSRVAIGVAALPLGAPVEIAMILEVRD